MTGQISRQHEWISNSNWSATFTNLIGSYISHNESRGKCVKVHIGETATVFLEKNENDLKEQQDKLTNAVYEVNVSTFLYSAEMWPLTERLLKRLDAAHHRRQRIRCLLERQCNKRGSHGENRTTRYRATFSVT